MAHFAQLNEDGIVLQVIVVSNDELLDETGAESESKGIEFCAAHFGGRWVQTSYNSKIRKNYAGVGYTYDQARDSFIPPQPFNSWTLNEQTCKWESPKPYPEDGSVYKWDESALDWVKI